MKVLVRKEVRPSEEVAELKMKRAGIPEASAL
jgi:hypothetical protein